jgi:hypothetical protein
VHVLDELVVIDMELPGITGIDLRGFSTTPENGGRSLWFVISASAYPTTAAEILNSGAFPTRKSVEGRSF